MNGEDCLLLVDSGDTHKQTKSSATQSPPRAVLAARNAGKMGVQLEDLEHTLTFRESPYTSLGVDSDISHSALPRTVDNPKNPAGLWKTVLQKRAEWGPNDSYG